MCVTEVKLLKTRGVLTSYSNNNKENEKYLNLISMILKLYKLIQAYNC